MDEISGYQFDSTEERVLANALAMYAGYMQEMVLPMLVGDESDIESVRAQANASKRLAQNFIRQVEGQQWEEISADFQQRHGRPMDFSDYSEFDWFEHRHDGRP